MIVAIDIGNTRVKVGVHDGKEWTARSALPTPDAAQLSELAAQWPDGTQVVASNVAGEAVEAAVTQALGGRHRLRWLRSSREACGVRSRYEFPEKLGADRWAALIGARAQHASDCIVVCAGTATTVDHLDADGVFRGGLILPGIDLMRSSLARNTAQLPFADGVCSEHPRSTVDAIVSGCLFAQTGAIERMFSHVSGHPDALCLITGGAAASIVPQLRIPCRPVENLILEGLRRFAREG